MVKKAWKRSLGIILLFSALILSPYPLTAPPTEAATASPVPDYVVVWHDGFARGDTAHLTLPTGWDTYQDTGDWYLGARAAGHASPVKASVRANYCFRTRLRITSGWAALHFRSRAQRYSLEVMPGHMVLFGATDQSLANAQAPVQVGTWHTVAISGTLGHLQVSLDDTPYLDMVDPDPIHAGGVGLSAYGENVHVDFDDVQVLIPDGDPLPWQQTGGPSGGTIHAVEIDPSQPNTVYAAGRGSSVFKSWDGGQSWSKLPKLSARTDRITELLLRPDAPGTLYALGDQVYATTDGGEHWIQATDIHAPCSMAMSRTDSRVLAAGTWGGEVHLTIDGGSIWNDVSSNLPEGRIVDVAIGAPSILWAGIEGDTGGIYHSLDGGNSWQRVALPFQPNASVFRILSSPRDPDVVFVGTINVNNEALDAQTGRYLFVTWDGGVTWSELRVPRLGAEVAVVGVDLATDAIYVAAAATIFRSVDGGQRWTDLAPPPTIADTSGDIAIHPHDPNTLYLPTPFRGAVYKTTNLGATWCKLDKGLLNVSVSLLDVADLAQEGTLYATGVSGEGLFGSRDYGQTWTSLTENGITHPWADELVVSPHDPETIWQVADVGQVFRSTDGGDSFERIIDPYRDGFRFGSVSVLACAPSDADTIYAIKDGFGLFKSVNGGEDWRFLHRSEVDYTYALAVHPTDPEIVYCGYNAKPFQDWAMVRRTQDGGASWDTALHVAEAQGVTALAIDPSDPDSVYAGSTGDKGGQVHVSYDGGDTWAPLNEHFTMCTVWGQPQLIVDPADPSRAYVATWLAGTWATEDAGASWRLMDAPESATSISQDQANGDVLYLANRAGPDLWRSTDRGISWSAIADFGADGAYLVNRVLVACGAVYVSTFGPGLHGGSLYVSTTDGATWNDITGELPRSVLDLAVDPSNANTVYVTTHIYGAYVSHDGGATWGQLSDFPDIGAYDIEIDPVVPTTLYACGMGAGTVPDWCMPPDGYSFSDSSGVYKSVDAGLTWFQVLTTTNECRAIRLHPDDHELLLAAAMDDGLLVSTDGGATWQAQNAGLDTTVLTSCAVRGEKVYVGTQGCGVYAGDLITVTGAITWQAACSNKPVPVVHSLEIRVAPDDSDRLFVGSNPGGLYRSDDGGVTFYDKNFLTPSVVVDDPIRQGYYTFAVNNDDPGEVWVGTWGKGIFKSYDGMDFDAPASGVDRAMYGRYVTAIVVDPGPPHTVYVASHEGVFYSRDGGEHWHDMSDGLGTPQVASLAQRADGQLMCGTLGYEVYEYLADEATWRQLIGFGNFGTFWPLWNDRPLYQYTSLLFHPTDPDVIYAGTFPAGIYKSEDGGASWRERNVGWTNDGVFSLVCHPDNADIIYAGTYNGMNRTLDAGAHWEVWDEGWPAEQWVFSIAFDPRDADVMYACAKNGENEGTGREGFHGTVMKSFDGGATWAPITNGLDVDQEFYKVIVDPNQPDTVYLATQRDGVFISRDGGALWLPWNEGLTTLRPGTNGNNVTNTMLLSPSGQRLYLGTDGEGVFSRMAAGFVRGLRLPLVWASGAQS